MIHSTNGLFEDPFFKHIFQNSEENCILAMDETGSILAVNDAFLKNFGYTREALINKNLCYLFTKEDQERGKPQNEIATVLATEQASDRNFLLDSKGNPIWVSGESILVVQNNVKFIIKIIQDIDIEKQSENSLQHMHAFNEEILKSIKDVIIVVDEGLNIVKGNTAFYQLFRYPPKQHPVNFAMLVKPYGFSAELLVAVKNSFETGLPMVHLPVEFSSLAGHSRMYDISSALMTTPDSKKNLLLVIRDITLHKQLEREREDIIGFVAHELRNPLANLVLINALMEDTIQENNNIDLLDLLQRSRNNVDRLNRMINELYNATKVSSGNINLEITHFSVQDMIQEAVTNLNLLQPEYRVIVEGNGQMQVNADRHRLVEVVSNYISNGIKYSNGNTEVRLDIKQSGDEVIISVADRGLGISMEQLPFVFERFFRAEKTRNLEGIGLGLYLCKRIINAHNGRVWAESKEGEGSVFYFSLPLSTH